MRKNQRAELYCIIYIPTGQKYIGITWGKNFSFKKRFKKHLNGKGSCAIKRLLESGAKKEDFTISLIEEGLLSDLLNKEAELAELYPKGLNHNKGNAFMLTDEMKRKAQAKRDLKMPETIKKIALKSNETKLKQSIEMKKYLSKFSEEEMKDRLEKSLRNCDHKKRGEAISKGKKGKKTNQMEITECRYKNMINDEFNEWCVGRKKWVIIRAINLRNK